MNEKANITDRSPLRVAILDHTARLGGGETALLNLARHIDRARFALLVILFSDGPLNRKLKEAGIHTLLVPLDAGIGDARKDEIGGKSLLSANKLKSAATFIGQLAAVLKQHQIQLVHTNSLKSDLLGGLAARRVGIPVLWHVRDRIANDYLPCSVAVVFRALARVIPHKVVANSYATLSTLRLRRPGDLTSWNLKRFGVIHDGAEIGPVHPASITAPADASRLIVGLVGRITRWKGQHIFLQAIALIRDQFPQARFQIIGAALFDENAYEQELRNICRSLGLNDIVDFMGFRDDVSTLVDRMDLLVHASTIGEPFGQVILEGMAAGKAVVATRGGGVPEFVQDKVSGLLVPMNDAPALAAAMAELLGDTQRRQEMGRRARDRVVESFTIQHTADKMQRLYEQMQPR